FWEAGEKAFQAESHIILQSGKINFEKLANIKFEEEVFPQAESSDRKGKKEQILKSRDDIKDPKIEEKFEQLRTKLKAHKSRKEYIFDFLNEISNKNDASIFALRGAINDMLEEYKRDTNLAITITRANNAQNEEARKAIQNKYRDLLATQLETKCQIIIEENIETQLSKNQSQIQTKPPPPRLELPKTRYREEYQYPGSPSSPPKSPTESDKSSTNLTIDRSGSSKQHIQQHTHSPKKPSSLRNSVDLTNTPDIVLLTTPIPIQSNQQTRNPKRPIDR
ncbi:2056_t:CDS:2, partial [Dentiscutata heterogama]